MMTKGNHYLELLEIARCEGNWDAVPELVRKVRKHASSRSCLALAAETECAISNATTHGPRPSAAATARDLDVANRLPTLQSAISEENANSEDRFQAHVCVGWLHWVVGDYSLAIRQLPKMEDPSTNLDPANLVSEWTHVCALKSAYLRANCLMRDGQRIDALAALRSAAPVLNRVESGKPIKKQLRYWSELFLTEYCMLSSEAVKQGDVSRQDASVLAPYRSWATYWEVMQAPVTGGFGFKGSVPRRQVWNEYYMVLSHILQNDIPYEAGLVKRMPGDSPSRTQLRTEIKYAEAAYRSLLLAETSFPRADEDREEVEEFVQQVMKNWSILCGRGWREEDLGQGGRSATSRGVLETLYSAATRTYHSTAILRSLFCVHLSLAEFDLAFKAFDSYLDIVKRGKARVDKTGEAEPSLDSDSTVLETMAHAIMALCRYGRRQAGEKARQLGAELEDWLSRLPPIKGPENGTPSIAEDVAKSDPHPPVAPNTVALAWQAIGHSHAHWSRLTNEAGSRIEIQAKAIRCLRKSIAPEFGRCKDIRTFFTLALLLAERRELTAAIELTRSALMANKDQERGKVLLNGPYWQERTLIPLWHLLALLLSARQDYAMAFRACEGALEQFKDPTVLFGKTDASFRSEHLEVAGAPPAAESRRGLVDSLDDSEKESILEIKMTQLALIELTEGPEMAVNASFELLTMFTRLFGNITAQAMPSGPTPAQPPKTSGTFRGIRGSIFGAKTDKSVASSRGPGTSIISEKSAAMASRPSTAHSVATAKPSIHATVVDGDVFFTPAQEPDQVDLFPFSNKPSRFPKEQERAQRMAILVRIWLTVAGFYRRADMLEDSKGAIAEAQKLVQDLESQDQSGASGPKSTGWAEKKSVDDLWGDVWSELGLLALAQSQPLVARSDLEQALTYCPDHPAATVCLCSILLDISSEKLLPAPVVPPLDHTEQPPPQSQQHLSGQPQAAPSADGPPGRLPSGPLGLCPRNAEAMPAIGVAVDGGSQLTSHPIGDDSLPAAYKATRLPLVDRLAARDRAFALLTGLTRLGTGWDYSDAWFALARAYEESGQPDKAKEVLWWCVELEEAMGVREWRCLGGGGYLI
ncbi:filamentation protein (Rhf1) [Hirsutella rhossiliensis]|uniref:Filamentation protein (Rhf1) n=1 Tax=Hirsutella rhossiliensis TaxID=111463 RepID=A0A9P8N2X6_9HYPO|nr:filamentation protein (Rhf1) [Hirsutella rhossiliensis]KAH0965942.1 filamentation protein (Rhf1) [Hirsutella rhossiliensis]